jgi:hypothetical protein
MVLVSRASRFDMAKNALIEPTSQMSSSVRPWARSEPRSSSLTVHGSTASLTATSRTAR